MEVVEVSGAGQGLGWPFAECRCGPAYTSLQPFVTLQLLFAIAIAHCLLMYHDLALHTAC